MFGPTPGPNKAPSFGPQRDYSLSVHAVNGETDLIPGEVWALQHHLISSKAVPGDRMMISRT